MANQPKKMKYRRRPRAPESFEYGQCSGALDWGALKQDPVELLRKVDELRDQITRSCELAPQQPGPRHSMSRRAISLRPSHAEPAPRGREPEYHRSRVAGRYGTSMPLSLHDQPQQRPLRDERQPSGRFRQFPEGQWESSGFGGQGSRRHHSTCQCVQCLQGRQPVIAAPEEHIRHPKCFAGQQGSFRSDRSQSVSSEFDRRSSSLYSHLSVSKRRVEYFRSKAQSFCRPMMGAAPFVGCSSCSRLLQLPPGKGSGRKRNQVRCGSCSEIVTFRPKQVKVHPLITPPSSLPASKSVTGSNHRDSKNYGWYQHQDDDDDFNFYKLRANGNRFQKKDFADSVSPSSTLSFGRTDSDRGSNRSIQLKSGPASRSRFSDSPKDISCQGDTDSQAAASVHSAVNQQGPVLEDKRIDPFSSLQKDYSRGEQTRNRGYSRDSKAGYEGNVRDERIDVKSIQKSKKGNMGGLEDECSNQTHEQIGRRGKTGSPEDTTNRNKYRSKINSDITSSLEDEGMRKKYDNNGSFRVQVVNKKYVENDDDTLKVKSIATRCEQGNIEDGKLLHTDSKKAKNESSANEHTNSISRVSSGADVDEIQSSTSKNGDSSFFAGFLKKGLKDLSLFSQPADSAKVSINGHPISDRALRKAEKKAGPVSPGSYW
jgi:hypothetical protein